MRRFLFFLIALILLPFSVEAHIGSPNVFFEGHAGPYSVHVVIQPAEVIPGLAEISVRVDAAGTQRVTALPIKWNAGRKGAPPPDVAQLVRGETNLYTTQLWFMETGAHSVEIEITGASGVGRVTIPVDAVARRVLTMSTPLGGVLVGLGLLLIALLLSIVGAAVRESVVPPGTQAPPGRRWHARSAMGLGAVVLTLLLWGSKHWWAAEAADYRNNRLYRAVTASANVYTENGQRVLRLEISDPDFARSAPLVPEHGKLMHLFLVREPNLDAFAHLHPLKRDRRTFETVLPGLPGGSYRLYGDVTYETGLSDTLTAAVEIPEIPTGTDSPPSPGAVDPDDSWRVATSSDTNARACQLDPNYRMDWLVPPQLTATRQLLLQFKIGDSEGRPAELESYLGMRGHLALRRDDGSVFTHLHPGGSASMAAMQLSVLRAEGRLPLQAAFGQDDPVCQLPFAGTSEAEWLSGSSGPEPSTITFPYAFPKPGRYRLWVQVKVSGKVLTGVFDAQVGPDGSS
jgi:hypothetical protein